MKNDVNRRDIMGVMNKWSMKKKQGGGCKSYEKVGKGLI